MPWTTPTLKETRRLTRDYVLSQLGASVMIPNSVLRIISDAMAGLAHLCLLYIDWLSKQQLPDTAEREWLDRHGDIWLTNSDGSTGRKVATFAEGTVTITGEEAAVVPAGTILGNGLIQYQVDEEVVIPSAGSVVAAITALTAGTIGNLDAGEPLNLSVTGVDGTATVISCTGGTDVETDDDLRDRVLLRIRQPPMGGDAKDYEQWALAVPGVTRAWASVEMGVGTVTLRFMMDDLRSARYGLPLQEDIDAVAAYIDSVRPVAIKDRFIVAPIPEPVDVAIVALENDSVAIRAEIEVAIEAALRRWAAPARIEKGIQQDAQAIYASWISDAIMGVSGVKNFRLIMEDKTMPTKGSIGVLGSVIYG